MQNSPQLVPKEIGSTVINEFQEAWGFSLAEGKAAGVHPNTAKAIFHSHPRHKSALNALLLTCQAFPWMSFHRHTLLGPQVIWFDGGTSKRGDLVDISGRSVGLDTSNGCQQRLQPSQWESLPPKQLESGKTTLEIS